MTGASQDPSPQSDFARVLREAAPYLGMGTALATTVGLSFAFGFWLDGLLGTKPFIALASGGSGVVIALVQFVRMASNLNKPQDLTSKKQRHTSKP